MTNNDAELTPDTTTVSGNDRLSLTELTEAAGVSARTVRYYVAEGLLAPPVAAGAKSFYARGHLDRLRLIAQFKASYLPLKEIRRRIAALDDAGVRAQLAARPLAARESGGEARDSAAAYVDRLLKPSARTPAASPSMAAPSPGSTPMSADSFHYRASMAPYATAGGASSELIPPTMEDFEPSVAPIINDQGAWRRVSLGDDAELLIREEAYRRKRDRVEWLVTWARKVFG